MDSSDGIMYAEIEHGKLHDNIQSDTNFTGVHLNIRSVIRNYDSLKVFLYIENKYKNLDFIALTECWAARKDLFNFNLELDGYDLYVTESKYNQNGGVIIYIKKSYKVSLIDFDERGISCDILGMNIQDQSNTTSFNLIALYRSPSRSKKDFLESIDLILKVNKNNYKNSIIIGDFNMDVRHASTETDDLLNNFAAGGFRQIIKSSTRMDGNSGSIIDLCFTNFTDGTINAGSIKANITDHFPIYISLPYQEKKRCIMENKKYITIDYKKIAETIDSRDWVDLYSKSGVNAKFDYLQETLGEILKMNTHEKTMTNHYNGFKTSWITKSIIKSIRKRDKMAYNIKRNINATQQQKQKLRDYTKILRNLINAEKSAYYL